MKPVSPVQKDPAGPRQPVFHLLGTSRGARATPADRAMLIRHTSKPQLRTCLEQRKVAVPWGEGSGGTASHAMSRSQKRRLTAQG